MTCATCDGRGWVPSDRSHGDACPDCYPAGPPTPRKPRNDARMRAVEGVHIGSKNKKQPGGFHHRRGHR